MYVFHKEYYYISDWRDYSESFLMYENLNIAFK